MASIINNPNSFIQFGGGGTFTLVAEEVPTLRGTCINCDEIIDPCLPIHRLQDIAFQFIVTGADEAFISDLSLGVSVNGCPEEVDFIEDLTNHAYLLDDGSYVVVFDFNVGGEPIVLCDELLDGTCITFVLFDAGDESIYTCSQCFTFKRDACYTQQIKYRCNENSFGFKYEEQILPGYTEFFNRVRLFLTINRPQFPSERDVFTLSDGTHLKLAEVIEEESEVLTEYYGKQWHRAMKIALSHDEFYVYDDAADAFHELHCDSDYPIEWVDEPGMYTGQGQAKFKLKTTPFYNENMNC